MTAIPRLARSAPKHAPPPGHRHLRELDWLMFATVALCCLGLVMAVSVRGAQIDVGPMLALKQQGGKLMAGLVAFLLAALLPMSVVRRMALPLFFAATAACLLPHLSREVKGAARWIHFGSFQLQPVEPARLCLVLAVASLLARAGVAVREFRRGFLPTMACTGLLAGVLLLQPDNGNALIVLMLGGLIALIAGVRFRHFVPVAIVGVSLLVYAASRHDYVRSRMTGFLSADPSSQVGLGLIAVGSGGLTGRGLGQGWMKMNYVPEAHNDFVFAIIGEELGFLGCLFVLAAFSTFGIVCYRLAGKVRDPFRRYLICGYALMVCVQAALNLLVVSGWAPAKGIDLPFVSTGGTSLMFCLAAVGLIGNAARSDQADTSTTAMAVPRRSA